MSLSDVDHIDIGPNLEHKRWMAAAVSRSA